MSTNQLEFLKNNELLQIHLQKSIRGGSDWGLVPSHAIAPEEKGPSGILGMTSHDAWGFLLKRAQNRAKKYAHLEGDCMAQQLTRDLLPLFNIPVTVDRFIAAPGEVGQIDILFSWHLSEYVSVSDINNLSVLAHQNVAGSMRFILETKLKDNPDRPFAFNIKDAGKNTNYHRWLLPDQPFMIASNQIPVPWESGLEFQVSSSETLLALGEGHGL